MSIETHATDETDNGICETMPASLCSGSLSMIRRWHLSGARWTTRSRSAAVPLAVTAVLLSGGCSSAPVGEQHAKSNADGSPSLSPLHMWFVVGEDYLAQAHIERLLASHDIPCGFEGSVTHGIVVADEHEAVFDSMLEDGTRDLALTQMFRRVIEHIVDLLPGGAVGLLKSFLPEAGTAFRWFQLSIEGANRLGDDKHG